VTINFTDSLTLPCGAILPNRFSTAASRQTMSLQKKLLAKND
jgi:hypothetical protein